MVALLFSYKNPILKKGNKDTLKPKSILKSKKFYQNRNISSHQKTLKDFLQYKFVYAY